MALSTSGFGTLFTRAADELGIEGSYGTQTAWAVDEVAGDDANVGSPSAPLKSVTELNARLSDTIIQQNTTIQFVGNVTQALELYNTRVNSGMALTILGTTTSVATGTIATVTALGPGSGYPWQVDTTGVNWTLITDRRLITNTNKVFWISEVIDADTVILSAGSIAASTGVQTPLAAETFTVHSLSTMPLPTLNVLGPFVGSTPFGLDIQNVRMTGGPTAPTFNCIPRFRVFGCQLDLSTGFWMTGQSTNIVSCKLTNTVSTQFVVTGQPTFSFGLFAGSGSSFIQYRTAGRCIVQGMLHHGMRMTVSTPVDVQGGGIHFRSCSGGDTVATTPGGLITAPTTTSFCAGSGNTGGFGITIVGGTQYIYNTSAKPTLTNASGDTKIGGTTTAYASIPFVNTTNNAQMTVAA